MRATLWLAIAVAAIGCRSHEVIVAPDGGGPDARVAASDAGPDAAADAGTRREPVGGSECDQQDHCDTCATCSVAPRQVCNAVALACEEWPACLRLLECLHGCPDDEPSCARACAEASPEGREGVLALQRCLACDACPADCRDHRAWCVEPPI